MADGAHSTGLCSVLESAASLLGVDYVFFCIYCYQNGLK